VDGIVLPKAEPALVQDADRVKSELERLALNLAATSTVVERP
jgi:hypothetical protein